MNNEMILASAGSGKTWQLTNRYIAIMAREMVAGREPQPERIVAITFTRKAAGEFFDSILTKLACASTSEKKARALAGPPGHPLHPILSKLTASDYRQLLAVFVRRMPRLFLGTLDSFFSNIIRSFPAEFGLSEDFEILDDHRASLARDNVYRRVFQRSDDLREQSEFLEAFRLATFGKEESTIRSLLDRFIDEHHEVLLTAPSFDLWGNEHAIWPGQTPWLQTSGKHEEDLDRLFDIFTAQQIDDRQWIFWRELKQQLLAHTPGNALPKRAGFFLTKFLEKWDDITAGHAEFPVNRKKQSFDGEACDVLRRLTVRIVAQELESHLVRTQGLWNVLHQYERHYASMVRRRGYLTFHDLEVILAGGDLGTPAPVLTQQPDPDTRLRIDYRLDANYHHWLLDEFQDTSHLQWSVIENLIDEAVQDPSGDRSLFQVGDVKQAIYAWRGGDTRLFHDIQSRYEGLQDRALKTRSLNVSWRSGPDVIQPLNCIFGDPEALQKLEFPAPAIERWTWQGHEVAPPNQTLPGHTAYYQPEPADPEAGVTREDCYALTLAILEEVQPLKHQLSCALLVQDNKTSRELVDYIRAHSPSKLPVVSESDLAIAIDNPVTLAFLSLFRVAAHPHDGFAAGHLKMSPIGQILADQDISIPRLSSKVRSQVHYQGFESTLRHWDREVRDARLLDDPFSIQRLEELALAARLFDATGDRSIDSFLRYAESHTIREPDSHSAIQVMTIHKSKGLTFDMVILPQLGGDSLTNPRKEIGVQRKREDRSVQWVFDIPRRAIAEVDDTLRGYRIEQEAEAGYEELCKFYVAMTRARYANYLIAPPRKPNSRSRNFIKLLDDTLGGEETSDDSVQGIAFRKVYETRLPTTRRDWWMHLPEKEDVPEPEPAPEPPPFAPRPRPARRTPSRHDPSVTSLARMFSRSDNSARELGNNVHELFEAIDWAETTDLSALPSSHPDALAEVARVLADPACREALSRPSLESGQSLRLWREQDFEILLDGHWVSGTIDRAVIIDNESGQALSAHIIDYKTDLVRTKDDAVERAQVYRSQLESYRAAASTLLSLPPESIRLSLVFTRLPLLVSP